MIIESYGVGGLPTETGFHEIIRKHTDAGKFIVMTTQVQNDGSDLGVYHVGYSLKGRDHILEAYDILHSVVLIRFVACKNIAVV